MDKSRILKERAVWLRAALQALIDGPTEEWIGHVWASECDWDPVTGEATETSYHLASPDFHSPRLRRYWHRALIAAGLRPNKEA